MYKLASQLLDKTTQFIQENPGIVTGLAATGGLGALGGAVFTDVDDDDSASEKFKKRLKNALITGGLASAAFGAGAYGLNKIQNALPEDDVSPMSAAIHSTPVRLLGLGAGGIGGHMLQQKSHKAAINQVFGDTPMSKSRLIDILNNPVDNPAEFERIEKAWGNNSKALKEWIEATGVDPAAIKPKLTGMDNTAAAIDDLLNKNKAVGDVARRVVNPETLAKAIHKIKANKVAVGLTGAGLLLPEIASATGNAVSSLFGGSLYE
jgi:hypothetical protein